MGQDIPNPSPTSRGGPGSDPEVLGRSDEREGVDGESYESVSY